MNQNADNGKEKGSLTIEATISLVVFMILFIIFLTFGSYVRLQNEVKHSLDQTALTMSMVNSLRSRYTIIEDLTGIKGSDIAGIVRHFDQNAAQDVNRFFHEPYTTGRIAGVTGQSKTSVSGINNSDIEDDIKKYFVYYLYPEMTLKEIENANQDELIKKKGIENFRISAKKKEDKLTKNVTYDYVDGSKITINLTYDIGINKSLLKFFSISEGPEFTESITFVLAG